MNQSFFIGAVGAHQQQKRLNVQGNNIANVNTYGFKAEKGRFAALMYEDIKAVDDAQLPAGAGACLWTTDTDFSSGAGVDTGRAQDYMISGDGFFALVDLATNEVSLTRNGAFSIAELQRATGETDEQGQPVIERVMYLSDGDGRFVLSDTGSMIEVTVTQTSRWESSIISIITVWSIWMEQGFSQLKKTAVSGLGMGRWFAGCWSHPMWIWRRK